MRSLLLAMAMALPLFARAQALGEPPPLPEPVPPPSLAPKFGVDGLCSAVATEVHAAVPANSYALGVQAEGVALDIADSVQARCAKLLDSPTPSGERVPVQLRLRVDLNRALLVAFVELEKGAASTAIAVPLGNALESWLSSGGAGIESWLIGSVEGNVLALCGAGQTIAYVTPDQVGFVRWTSSGLTPGTRLDLPATLRSRARAPAASAFCLATPNGMTVALGMHDRGKGVVIRYESDTATWTTPLDGIPIGFSSEGTPILASADNGANTLRWKDQSLAQAMLLGKTPDSPIAGISPAGALVYGDKTGAPGTFGSSFAVADLDHDGVLELVVTRPIFPGTGTDDRLSVRPLETPTTVVHESRSIKGALGAVGLVTTGDWTRAVAAEPGLVRTRLFAVGLRQPRGGH